MIAHSDQSKRNGVPRRCNTSRGEEESTEYERCRRSKIKWRFVGHDFTNTTPPDTIVDFINGGRLVFHLGALLTIGYKFDFAPDQRAEYFLDKVNSLCSWSKNAWTMGAKGFNLLVHSKYKTEAWSHCPTRSWPWNALEAKARINIQSQLALCNCDDCKNQWGTFESIFCTIDVDDGMERAMQGYKDEKHCKREGLYDNGCLKFYCHWSKNGVYRIFYCSSSIYQPKFINKYYYTV